MVVRPKKRIIIYFFILSISLYKGNDSTRIQRDLIKDALDSHKTIIFELNFKIEQMKKLTLFLAALFCSTIMFGQFHFGPQVGYTASNLTLNTSDITNNLKSNLLVGAFARFGKKLYVQPEVNWLTQGSVFRYPTVGFGGVNLSPVEQEIKLSTIQIPLSLGFNLLDLNVVNLRIHAGATANIVVNKEITTTDSNEYVDPLKESDINDLQWQYQAGLGVDVLMFALDVKYMGGINELINGNVDIDGESQTISSKSNLFVVTLGWKIF